MAEPDEIAEYADFDKMMARWQEYKKGHRIIFKEDMDRVISGFVQTDAGHVAALIDRHESVDKQLLYSYLNTQIHFLQQVPTGVLGHLKDRYQLDRMTAEINEIQVRSYPQSTLWKVALGAGAAIIGYTTGILGLGRIEDFRIEMIISLLGYGVGLFLTFYSLFKLKVNEEERMREYRKLFPAPHPYIVQERQS